MGYADELLARDETILRRERQHPILPFLIAGRPVALAAGITVLAILLNVVVFRTGGTGFIGDVVSLLNTLLLWVMIVAFVIAAGGFAWSIARWRTQEYVLTNQRVIGVHGVVNRQSSDSSLESLSDARIDVPLLGRMLGFGDLFLMTASEAGNQRLRALRDPIAFKRAIMEAKTERSIELNTARRPVTVAAPIAVPVAPRAPAAPAPAPAAPVPGHTADDVAKGIAALATLRDSGAITTGEFEAKKRELLDRL
jgi:uncharacterized membrane protein YdbT with pleckstrin-like domain